MKVIYRSFEKLSSKELMDALRLRQQVFIIEQTCFYEDIDGADPKAEHLLYYDEDQLAAYLRVFPAGVKYPGEASLGRIVVAPEYRGTGLGPKLIRDGLSRCECDSVRIEAQAALKGYYNHLGFKEEGETYIVDDILHLQMVWKA